MIRRNKEQKIFYYSQPGIYRRKIMELETAEERVCWLFKNHEHLRNCTKCLIFHYWFLVDNLSSITELSPELLHQVTPAETITRAARHIQNDLGLWLPTDENELEARRINEFAVKEWATRHKGLVDELW